MVKSYNISTFPGLKAQDDFEVPILLKIGAKISTNKILKAGPEVLHYGRNFSEISKILYTLIGNDFYVKELEIEEMLSGHIAVIG
ncbi:MAG: hypothetical protein JJU37_02940 [Balneolaceae bacterium]|nr:hypothetical protein [Balneolaceae bacterium]